MARTRLMPVLLLMAAALIWGALRFGAQEPGDSGPPVAGAAEALAPPSPVEPAAVVEVPPIRSEPVPETPLATVPGVPENGDLERQAQAAIPSLTGSVVDTNGSPLAGASVELYSISQEDVRRLGATSSDDAGRFSFPWPAAVQLQVDRLEARGRAAGYQSATARFLPGADGGNGESVLRAMLRLAPGGTVTGRVVTSAGQPVAGARVRLLALDAQGRLVASVGQAAMRTGGDGRFAVGAGAGERFLLDVRQVRVGRLRREWPLPSVGASLDIGDVVLGGPCYLRGRVLDLSGAPAPHLRLVAGRVSSAWWTGESQVSEGLERSEAWTDATGAFLFAGLGPGDYTVTARFSGVSPELVKSERGGVQLSPWPGSGKEDADGARGALTAVAGDPGQDVVNGNLGRAAAGQSAELTGDFRRLILRMAEPAAAGQLVKVKCQPPEDVERYAERGAVTDGMIAWSPAGTLDILVTSDETVGVIAWVLENTPGEKRLRVIAHTSRLVHMTPGLRSLDVVLNAQAR
ncbi:MAG: carboxypeptidase-like regulatory domain-containing protein [Planctomycetota bacterium]|nr:carboxypeptidase-like regulatory domain-containing protein [Planctomycetota bacterium]